MSASIFQGYSHPYPQPKLKLDACKLPVDFGYSPFFVPYGQTAKTYLRFYYDNMSKSCKPFPYYGAGGNINNFKCDNDCIWYCNPAKVCKLKIKNINS